MPNHKSAIKRALQNERRRTRNRHVISTLRTRVKQVKTAIDVGDAETARSALPVAVKALERAAGKGVIHRNQAQRRIGRLVRAVNQLG